MDTAKAQAENSLDTLIQTVACLIILVALCFSLSALSEFYAIAVQKNTGAYPWGAVNDNPWYYKTPVVYSIYNLISGVLLLAMALSAFWSLMKRNRRVAIISFFAIVSMFLVSLLSAGV